MKVHELIKQLTNQVKDNPDILNRDIIVTENCVMFNVDWQEKKGEENEGDRGLQS